MSGAHVMPFGAQLADGATRFRLWAPAATRVDLLLGEDAHDVRPLAALDDGWYECMMSDAPAGTRYAYRIDGDSVVPDPASRSNPDGVHAASAVVDPGAYAWQHRNWRGRPWDEAVIYELHIGTFTPEGTFAAAIRELPALVELGVTAIELMPVADFPGERNWGYDGVLLFAPARCYGMPEDLKRLIDAAHGLGVMVMLDVVYNHFGPEGNYLHRYAPSFFDSTRSTPWGAAINFDGAGSRHVRDFFIHNALYWIEEYCFDGLRVDAVHALVDCSPTDIVVELAMCVRAAIADTRHVHLVLENDHNAARLLVRDAASQPQLATAQWNDDLHHAAHVLATGEHDGYYADYAAAPLAAFGRCLAEGFAFQGEPSPFRDHEPRGEPSAHLPADAFVNFLQNHDQVGNRAFGERLVVLAPLPRLGALMGCLLLAPSPPLLFMGEEYGARTPFLFFCDFSPDLAAAVVRGRRSEFARFARFADPAMRANIPDPGAVATFASSRLDRREAQTDEGREWLALVTQCLAVRRAQITPFFSAGAAGDYAVDGARLDVRWTRPDGRALWLRLHLGAQPLAQLPPLPGRMVYESEPGLARGGAWPAAGVAASVGVAP